MPDSEAAQRAISDGQTLQRRLSALAGRALHDAPLASAPRLYVESLNETIDMQTGDVGDGPASSRGHDQP